MFSNLSRTLLPATLLLACLGFIQCGSAEKDRMPITTSSDEARTEFVAGRALVDNARYHDALRHFQKAVRIDSGFALAYLFQAYSNPSAKGFFDNLKLAEAHADKVSEGEQLLIASALAGANGDLTRQREMLGKLTKMYPRDEGVLFFFANAYFGQQMYDSAAVLCEQTVQLAPSYAAPYNIMGYAYRALGKPEDAARAFQEYIRLIPHDPNPYDSYAELLTHMGRFEEAIQQYSLALKQDPSFGASHVGIAANLVFLGRYDDARSELVRLLDSSDNRGHRRGALVGIVVSYVDEGNFSEAVAQLQRLYEFDASLPDPTSMSNVLRSEAYLLARLGRFEESENLLNQAVEVVVNSDVFPRVKSDVRADHAMWLASLRIEEGRLDEAQTLADQYLEHVKSSANPIRLGYAHLVRGRVAVAKGDFTQGVAELELTNLQNAWPLYHLAMAYEGLGDLSRAAELYDQAAKTYELNSLLYALIRKHAAGKALELKQKLIP